MGRADSYLHGACPDSHRSLLEQLLGSAAARDGYAKVRPLTLALAHLVVDLDAVVQHLHQIICQDSVICASLSRCWLGQRVLPNTFLGP